MLLLVGGVKLNGDTPKLASAIVHVLMVGITAFEFTVKLAVFVPAAKSKKLVCDAVMIAGVPSVPAESVTTR